MPAETTQTPLRQRREHRLSCGDRGLRPADAGRARGEHAERPEGVGEVKPAFAAARLEHRIARDGDDQVSVAGRLLIRIAAAIKARVRFGDRTLGKPGGVLIEPGVTLPAEPLLPVLLILLLVRLDTTLADLLGQQAGPGAGAAIPPLAGGEDARRVRELKQRLGVVDAAGSHREDRGDFGRGGHRARPPSLTPYVVVDVKQSVRFKPDC
jgi:hypothetical protein